MLFLTITTTAQTPFAHYEFEGSVADSSANAYDGALDENGELFTRGAGGLLAQIIQHETDHLDGTLFVDKAEEVWEKKDTKSKKGDE